VLYDVQSFSALAGKVKRLLGSPRFLLLFGVLALLVFLPQLLYWHRQTGYWLFYSYGEKGSFFFLRPRIADGLFSYRKGWLLYTPVMILALAGIPLLYKKYKLFFASVAVTFILAVYVMFSFWCWWYGGSFGCRPHYRVLRVIGYSYGSSICSCVVKKNTSKYGRVVCCGLHLAKHKTAAVVSGRAHSLG
jgi:hypothetical protein